MSLTSCQSREVMRMYYSVRLPDSAPVSATYDAQDLGKITSFMPQLYHLLKGNKIIIPH